MCLFKAVDVVIMTFFGFSLIYILYLDAGEWSYFVFRLGWTAGRSALTIPTCVQSPIWHRLKPALSWSAVSDDCLSLDVATCLLLHSAWHRCPAQPAPEPANSLSPNLTLRAFSRDHLDTELTSLFTRSPGHRAYESAHEITWTRSLCPPYLN